MNDQAQRLRQIFAVSNPKETAEKKIIAISSGKGGTGKTFIAVNLAYLFAHQNKKVLLVDFDINLASAEIVTNYNTEKNIVNFFNNEVLLDELIQKLSDKLHIIFANSGSSDFCYPNESQIAFFYRNLSSLLENYDYIIIDTGAGVNSYTLNILQKADFIFFVVTPEPTSVMDAYVLIKHFYSRNRLNNFAVVVNKAENESEGIETYKKLESALTNFLRVKVFYLGYVGISDQIHRSLVQQEILVENYPGSREFAELQTLQRNIEKFIQLYNSSQPDLKRS